MAKRTLSEADLRENVVEFLGKVYGFPTEKQWVKREYPVEWRRQRADLVFVVQVKGREIPVCLIEIAKSTGENAFKNEMQEALDKAEALLKEKELNKIVGGAFCGTSPSEGKWKFWIRSRSVESGGKTVITEEILSEEPIPWEKLLEALGIKREQKTFIQAINPEDFFVKLAVILLKNKRKNNNIITKKDVEKITEFLQLMLAYERRKYDVERSVNLPAKVFDKIYYSATEEFDLLSNLGVETALAYRNFVARVFEGGELAQFVTPAPLIDLAVALVGKLPDSCKVLDFECGTGGFLLKSAKELAIPPTTRGLRRLKGFDKDELMVKIARVTLALAFGIKGINNWKVLEECVKEGDGLLDAEDDAYDLVISNPSGKDHCATPLTALRQKGIVPLSGGGKLSEYEAAIQRAIKSAKAGGEIVMIVPESFLSGSRNDKLRQFVLENCEIKSLILLPRGVFYQGTGTPRGKGKAHAGMQMCIVHLKKLKGGKRTRRIKSPGETLLVNLSAAKDELIEKFTQQKNS